ncbi:MAG: D-alanyl-D-alanine carboxypeptidase/D-alanyl-D-alanine-endopeptidase [Chryseolinea sp.]
MISKALNTFAMVKVYVALLCATIAFSCSPISKKSLTKTFRETELKFQDYTGFMLVDVSNNKTVFEYNSDRYFTPASNTKIFTFYASLSTLGDSIPSLRYVERGDSLIFWGTGDPSFLYRNVYDNGKVYSLLSGSRKQLYFSSSNFKTTHFGSGWAWDDYNDYYSAERSPLPIYGNLFKIEASATVINTIPKYYQNFVTYANSEQEQSFIRNLDDNLLTVQRPKTKTISKEVPAKVKDDLTVRLLSDTLKKTVGLVHTTLPHDAKTVYSLPVDSVYKHMMQESDNFIAEQLLLVCAGVLSDTLKTEITIERLESNQLKDMRDEPVWVDGSGLSRYNLFTPRSIVQLWQKINAIVPQERLFQILAIGGKAGTISNLYKADKPYIFGKTGSLSNNHCLSGFLITKSGKTLIFSFMNSNYAVPTSEIRKNMQNILNNVYEKY